MRSVSESAFERHGASIDTQLARCRTAIDYASKTRDRLPAHATTVDDLILDWLIEALSTLHLAVRKLHEPGYESAEEIRQRVDWTRRVVEHGEKAP